MNIHEYQGKELMQRFGIAVPKGYVAYTPVEAVEAAKKLQAETGTPVWVVKAQIHAGGRGKGGGVKVVKSLDDVKAEAQRMIGMQLITPQTGSGGQEVKRVYIEQGCKIARELYLGLLVDRATSRVTVMASTEGAEIEIGEEEEEEKPRAGELEEEGAEKPLALAARPRTPAAVPASKTRPVDFDEEDDDELDD